MQGKKRRSVQKKQRRQSQKIVSSPPKQQILPNSSKSNPIEKRKRTADDACLDRENDNNTINNFKKRRLYSQAPNNINTVNTETNNETSNYNSIILRKPLSPKEINKQSQIVHIINTNKILLQENEKLKLENLTLKLENDKLQKSTSNATNQRKKNDKKKKPIHNSEYSGSSVLGSEEDDFENFLNNDENEQKEEVITNKRQLNHLSGIKQNGKAFLYCRIRPLIGSELAENQTMDHISWSQDLTNITITKHGGVLSGGKNIVRDYSFGFDKVFPPSFKQTDVFKGTQLEKYVLKACRGGKVSLFCIGNTGSGKTYTIEGAKKTRASSTASQDPALMTPLRKEVHARRKMFQASSSSSSAPQDSDEENDNEAEVNYDSDDSVIMYMDPELEESEEGKGFIQRTVDILFQQKRQHHDVKYSFKFSAVEVYNETFRDLLDDSSQQKNTSKSNRTKSVQKTAPLPTDVVMENIYSPSAIGLLLTKSYRARHFASTKFNDHSSRSHCVFTFHISITSKYGKKRDGILHLIDLAGSERLLNEMNVPKTREKESRHINMTLSSLSGCLKALVNQAAFVPYRGNLLTRYLRKELEDKDAGIVILVHVSPNKNFLDQTVSSLQFVRSSQVKDKYVKDL